MKAWKALNRMMIFKILICTGSCSFQQTQGSGFLVLLLFDIAFLSKKDHEKYKSRNKRQVFLIYFFNHLNALANGIIQGLTSWTVLSA